MSLTRTFLGVWRINLCFVANRLYDEVKMTACWLHVLLRIYFRILPTIQSRNQIPLCRGYSQSSLYMFDRRLRAVPQSSLSSAGLERAKWPRGKLFYTFARFARFRRSRDHPDGLLSVQFELILNTIENSFHFRSCKGGFSCACITELRVDSTKLRWARVTYHVAYKKLKTFLSILLLGPNQTDNWSMIQCCLWYR